MTQELEHVDAPETESTPPRKRRWRRVLVALLLLPIVLFGAIVGMAQSERGTLWLSKAVNAVSAGVVHVDWRSGSLAHGGSAELVQIHLKKTQVDIHNVSGQWAWDYVPLKWRVDQLFADEVKVTILPSPSSDKPVGDILMPFALDVARLNVNTVDIVTSSNTTTLHNVAGALATDKRQHRIVLNQLTQGTAQYQGQMQIDGVRPFAVDGQIQANSTVEGQQYQLDLSAKGDFKHLNLDVQTHGAAQGQGHLELQLLERYYIHQGQVDLNHLNPHVFWNKLLKADLDVHLIATPQNLEGQTGQRQPVNGSWQVINYAPAPLSDFSLPVQQLSGRFALTSDVQSINDVRIELPNRGKIQGGGVWQNNQGEFAFDVTDFDLKNVHPKLLGTQLAGRLGIQANKDEQHFVGKFDNLGRQRLGLFADVVLHRERVNITQARITGVGEAKIELQGELAYTEGLPFKGKAQLLQFNLADLGDFPSSRLMGQFAVDGVSLPKAIVNVKGQLNDSSWAGAPAKASVDVSFKAPDQITARQLDVTIGVNHIDAKGALGVSTLSQDVLNLNVNAPNLAQLQLGLAGSVQGTAQLTGSLTRPRGKVDLTAKGFQWGAQTVQSASVQGVWESGEQGALNGSVELNQYLNGLVKLDAVRMNIKGTQAAHQFDANVQGNITLQNGTAARTVNGVALAAVPPVQWQLNAQTQGQGKINDKGWLGQITQLSNRGQPNVTLQQPMALAWQAGEWQLSGLKAQVQDAQLDVAHLNLLGTRINSSGRVSNLVIPQWLTWLNIALPNNISTDMTLKGQWDLTMGQSPRGGFSFERERGDLWLDKRQKNNIGLSSLLLKGTLQERQMNVTGVLHSERLGQVDITGDVGLVGSSAGWVVSGLSPLNLSTQAAFKELNQFNSLLGTNIKLQGEMQADLRVAGVLAAPVTSGVLTGKNLDFLHLEQGFRLKDGVMQLKLSDSSVTFEQFDFNGVEGKLSVRGQATYGNSGKLLNAQVTMDKLRPFVRLDRQLVLSGQAELGYDGGNQFSIKGKVKADKALIDLPPSLPPSLGDDVVVCSSDPAKSRRCKTSVAAAPQVQRLGLIPTIDLTLELGNDFRFKGQGADVKLIGSVHLASNQGSPLRTTGVVRVDSGSYKFYGQRLSVERGLITFQGPIDDPALNLFANRSVGTVEVGVELTGTLADSKARLTSNPEMPDEEKLSWMLFGRPSSTLSTTDGSAIAGAAAILLGSEQGRRISEKVGIDSFNFGSSDSGLTGTVVGLGKRLNDQFSVAYEQTLSNVAGVLKVTWSLSRNWQLVLRGGSISGADIQYSKRFDTLR
ncbi:MAG: translocation/assembly module TamB domain-containing protein [Formosimonas sp.]